VPRELTGHPDAETLAEYLDGGPAEPERSHVEAHLIACADCRTIVAEAAAFSTSNATAASSGARGSRSSVQPFRSRSTIVGVATALAAAALLVFAVRLVRPDWLGLGNIRNDREWRDLIAAVDAESTRPIDARLSGGFGYRPPPPVVRGVAGGEQSPAIRIAVAGIEQRAGARSLDDQSALATAVLVAGEEDRAITILESVVNARPADAAALSDLGAAYLARAKHGSTADVQKASTVLDRALRAKPDSPEALFNRALAAQLTDPASARAAWTAYLAVDSRSPWADEARRRQEQ
jgi:tetratricopeptide (TPR) repeat protein